MLHRVVFPSASVHVAYKYNMKEYSHLDCLYQFLAVAVESGGNTGPLLKTFLKHLSRRLRMSTGEPKSHDYLIQRISMAIQVGNTVSVLGSLPISIASLLGMLIS